MFVSGWEYAEYPLNVFWFWVDKMKIAQKRYKIVIDDVCKVG